MINTIDYLMTLVMGLNVMMTRVSLNIAHCQNGWGDSRPGLGFL